jgi:hypothetical protein
MQPGKSDVRPPVSQAGDGARLPGVKTAAMRVELCRKDIPDAELLDDLRAVATRLKVRRLSMSVYADHGKFCGDTYQNRFGGWTRAVKLAGLQPGRLVAVGVNAMANDIAEVARELKSTKLNVRQYKKLGRFSWKTICRRFGSWQAATEAAGILPGKFIPQNKQVVLENLRDLWLTLGRQPRLEDLSLPLSRCRLASYRTHFGSFNKAMMALDQFLNPGQKPGLPVSEPRSQIRRKTSRPIGPKLRYEILRRDNFRCCACGRSPVTHAGTSLQIDHKIPWSDGGESVPENLQTLCERCNSGKSDLA